jgi:hypothetical protein
MNLLSLLLVAQVTSITPTRTGTEAFWDNAMRRAFTVVGQNCINDSARRSGCRILLPCNTTMQFGSTLHISRSHIIEGCGPESTILDFPYHVTGVRFHDADGGGNTFVSTSPWDPIGGPASYGEMRNLHIRGNNHRTVTATVGHGIVIESAYVTLDNVRVSRFRGHGILLSADVTRTPSTNGNLARFYGVQVISSYWSGIYLRGGDANASSFVGFDASANCVSPTFSTSNPAVCGGIVDLSFLGNTYVAPHTASNGSRGYYYSGANQRATVIGGYAENDNPTNDLIHQTMTAVGGNIPWSSASNGLTLNGTLANQLRFRSTVNPANLTELCLGSCVNVSGHAFSLFSFGNNFANSTNRLTLTSELGFDGADWFAFTIDGVNNGRSIWVTQDDYPGYLRGQVWMQQAPMVGASSARATIRASDNNELFANNGSSTLAANIGPAATSITLATGTGARFPSPTGSQFFWATMEGGGNIEIVRCFSRTNDVIVCTRAQQGTTARTWLAGTTIQNRITAETMRALKDVTR